MSRKCPQCELVNWEYDEFCKRCSASLNPAAPPAHKWYVAYCALMALLYFVTILMGVVFFFMEDEPNMSREEAMVMGSVFVVMGLVFCVPYAAAPFLPQKSWVWVFGLVLICIGLSSACCLPVCIPLLIHWLKPEMKAFYGRTSGPPGAPPLPPQWS